MCPLGPSLSPFYSQPEVICEACLMGDAKQPALSTCSPRCRGNSMWNWKRLANCLLSVQDTIRQTTVPHSMDNWMQAPTETSNHCFSSYRFNTLSVSFLWDYSSKQRWRWGRVGCVTPLKHLILIGFPELYICQIKFILEKEKVRLVLSGIRRQIQEATLWWVQQI